METADCPKCKSPTGTCPVWRRGAEVLEAVERVATMRRRAPCSADMAPSFDEEQYYALIRDALFVCRAYKPMFGGGRKGGLSVSEFQTLYGKDPFYAWFGLDSPFVYSAHKAAGVMTFFARNAPRIRTHVTNAIEALLR